MATKTKPSPDKPRPDKAEIHAFAVANVEDHPSDLARLLADSYGLSRQTAHKRLRELVDLGILQAEGRTKARRYSLVTQTYTFQRAVTPELEENEVWRSEVVPHLVASVRGNVLEICQYGFTEMVNNVIDHSESDLLSGTVSINRLRIELFVHDRGVGIFEKIRHELHLEDARHALLELSKGKLTTDAARHSGEGIYFTSRMFDEFSIASGTLFFRRTREGGQWLIETREQEKLDGTFIKMAIHPLSDRDVREAFDEATSEDEDYRFRRTHVPILLAKYPDDQLVSRSQAKRVLARFERFGEVMLDFEGVDRIGQPFADEIFRVFKSQHPEVALIAVSTSPEVKQMIRRVSEGEPSE